MESRPQQGCTFKVFLPAGKAKAESTKADAAVESLPGGNETILVVEDEEDVRDFVVEVLKSRGYSVFSAVSGVHALERWPQYRQQIQLLLTDLVMPGGVSGHDLAERLTRDAPHLKVIYTSGYSPGMAGKDLTVLNRHNFLAKPHGPARLLSMVRRILDETGEPANRS